jgi:formylglycine-generating enzyme required for sulfatase activity
VGREKQIVLSDSSADALTPRPGKQLCPFCGLRNDPDDTFRCVACARDYLCLEHFVKSDRCCEECAGKTQRQRLEAERRTKQALATRRRDEEAQQRLEAERRATGQVAPRTLPASRVVHPPLPQAPEGMVLIPAGTFTMGSPADEVGRLSNETQHQVTLTKAFWVSKYPVTQAGWEAVMGWKSMFKGPLRPVERVTWFDAIAYCNKRSRRERLRPVYALTALNKDGDHILSGEAVPSWEADGYRLLTEAEWEYACRAGSTTAFCNGGITNMDSSPRDPTLDKVGWYGGNSGGETHDVGLKQPNAWDLHDMHGNVEEWCWDCIGVYPNVPVTDPTGPASGFNRVLRGGGWYGGARLCRSAYRYYSDPGITYDILGLRLSRTAR